MKTILFSFFLIISLGATAQEVDSRSIPDLKPIEGVATYDQFFAVQNCLTKGIRAEVEFHDSVDGTWTLFFKKYNVKVLRVSEINYKKYLARVSKGNLLIIDTRSLVTVVVPPNPSPAQVVQIEQDRVNKELGERLRKETARSIMYEFPVLDQKRQRQTGN